MKQDTGQMPGCPFGNIACEMVIAGPGPWAKTLWDMLELPKQISIKGADGKVHDNINMWIYWSLQEGTLGVDPDVQKTNDGKMPPVIHVDSNAPLYSTEDGSLITEEDAAAMRAKGVAAVFGSGSLVSDMVAKVKDLVASETTG